MGTDAKRDQQRLDRSLLIVLFPVVVLVVGMLLEGRLGWGINVLLSLPTPWHLLIPIAGLIVIVVTWMLRQPAVSLTRLGVKLPLLLALGLLFYLFRSESLVYGDGYTILTVALPAEPLSFHQQFALQPLSVILNKGWVSVLTSLGLPASVALALWKVLGGLTMIAATFSLTSWLFKSDHRLSATALILCSGATLLAFGYIENYTWPLAMLLWSLHLQILWLEERRLGWAAVATGLLATALHAIALPILLTAIAAFASQSIARFIYKMPAIKVVILLCFSSLFVTLASQLILDANPFVPLWPTDANPYWFLSPDHLLDLLNLLLMMSPLMLGLIAMKRQAGATDEVPRDIVRHVLLVAIGFGLIAFWIDPHIGAPRDWDLFSFFAIPANLLIVYYLSRRQMSLVERPISAILVAMVFLTPYTWLLNDSEAATLRLNDILWHDPHYSAEYDNAYRCLSWGVILNKALEDSNLDIPYYQRRLKADPSSSAAPSNLAEYFAKQRNFDSAAYYYGLAARNAPQNANYAANYAYMLGNLGQLAEALAAAERAIQLDARLPLGYTSAGIALMRMGRPQQGITYLRQAYDLNPESFDNRVNLGLGYAQLQQRDSTLLYFRKALDIAPRAEREKLLAELILMHRDAGDAALSQQYLQQYRRDFPNSTLLDQLLQSDR